MCEDRISRARTSIALDHPWLAALVMRLDTVIVRNSPILAPTHTAGTNGRTVWYDSDFVASISDAELVGLVVHEGLHCGMQHFSRIGLRDRKRWNIATDYAINQIIIENGISLPPGALIDPAFDGLGAEQIYDLLPKKLGNQFDSLIESTANAQELAQTWRDAMAEAVTIARRAGCLPNSIAREWDRELIPAIDWRELLIAHVQRISGKADYDWTRPNRRSLASGVILPGLSDSALAPIAICVDTSGSISRESISLAISCVREAAAHADVTVIYADTVINHVDTVGRGDIYTPRPITGGGGTDFRPALQYAENSQASCAVYITADAAGTFPEFCRLDTVWVVEDSAAHVPFGKQIVINGG